MTAKQAQIITPSTTVLDSRYKVFFGKIIYTKQNKIKYLPDLPSLTKQERNLSPAPAHYSLHKLSSLRPLQS